MGKTDYQPLLQDDVEEDSKTDISILNGSNYSRFNPAFCDIVEEKEVDSVEAIFVAAFDTHYGNVVEWSHPQSFPLESVEFKALPSGAHTIDFDFIYFRYSNMYGLGCYAKKKMHSDVERGARMKTVGILSNSYRTLYKHMQFLENQVRHQLQTPGKYERLEEFYYDHQSLPPFIDQQPTDVTLPNNKSMPIMKITHPAGCFNQLLNFFGASIFVLWKLVLLRKRILFFSPPPIGIVCYRVYCACCLGKITIDEFEQVHPKPYFYVNVADIDDIQSEKIYIACTTEKIFHEKPNLYDVYVDNQVITSSNPQMSSLLRINSSDKEKHQNLVNHKNDLMHQQSIGVEGLPSEESFYLSYFTQLNNQIFQILLEVSRSMDRTITNNHIKAMGLDPSYDRYFLMDLLELYGIDAMLVVDNPCCPPI